MEKIKNQHGDLILKEVSRIPKGANKKKIDMRIFTVLKGEGVNEHQLVADNLSEVLDVYEKDGVLYLRSSEPLTLTHEEHGVQTLEPNIIYKRVIEREFDFESEEARNTQD